MRKKTGKTAPASRKGDAGDKWAKVVYAFERDWPESTEDSLTLAQCKALSKLACAVYGVTAPAISFETKVNYSWYLDDAIGLVKTHLNKFAVLHETAHHISIKLFGGLLTEYHGCEFMSIYFFLLESAEIAPPVAFRASAKEHGLPWNPKGPKDLKNLQS